MNYPINVLRNVAIETSVTQYVLHASLQLMPSIGVIPIFLKEIAKGRKKMSLGFLKWVNFCAFGIP